MTLLIHFEIILNSVASVTQLFVQLAFGSNSKIVHLFVLFNILFWCSSLWRVLEMLPCYPTYYLVLRSSCHLWDLIGRSSVCSFKPLINMSTRTGPEKEPIGTTMKFPPAWHGISILRHDSSIIDEVTWLHSTCLRIIHKDFIRSTVRFLAQILTHCAGAAIPQPTQL